MCRQETATKTRAHWTHDLKFAMFLNIFLFFGESAAVLLVSSYMTHFSNLVWERCYTKIWRSLRSTSLDFVRSTTLRHARSCGLSVAKSGSLPTANAKRTRTTRMADKSLAGLGSCRPVIIDQIEWKNAWAEIDCRGMTTFLFASAPQTIHQE